MLCVFGCLWDRACEGGEGKENEKNTEEGAVVSFSYTTEIQANKTEQVKQPQRYEEEETAHHCLRTALERKCYKSHRFFWVLKDLCGKTCMWTFHLRWQQKNRTKSVRVFWCLSAVWLTHLLHNSAQRIIKSILVRQSWELKAQWCAEQAFSESVVVRMLTHSS